MRRRKSRSWSPPTGLLLTALSLAANPACRSDSTSIASVEVIASDGTTSTVGASIGERPLVVSLWAVWCQPCRRELPELSAVATDPSAGVDVLALNIGDDRPRVDEFLDELELDLPVVTDPDGDALEALDAATVPVTVILGVDGSVVWRHVGTVTRAEVDRAIAGL